MAVCRTAAFPSGAGSVNCARVSVEHKRCCSIDTATVVKQPPRFLVCCGTRGEIRTRTVTCFEQVACFPLGYAGIIGVVGETRTPKATRSERAPYANSGQSHDDIVGTGGSTGTELPPLSRPRPRSVSFWSPAGVTIPAIDPYQGPR